VTLQTAFFKAGRFNWDLEPLAPWRWSRLLRRSLFGFLDPPWLAAKVEDRIRQDENL